eukprot:317410-Rhodomonas_salina.1
MSPQAAVNCSQGAGSAVSSKSSVVEKMLIAKGAVQTPGLQASPDKVVVSSQATTAAKRKRSKHKNR